jgi:signal transduction histidine kinase
MVNHEVLPDHLLIQVTDHGCGIPDEFRSQIFKAFSQADASDTRKQSGTGLGLAISKKFIEAMGGTIGFESEPNVGTTFWIKLPIA